MEHSPDDNLIASFIDGKLTPLEQLVYSDPMRDPVIEEVIEISNDAKSLERIFCDMKPIRIQECERYIERIYNLEIPSNIGETPKSKLF